MTGTEASANNSEVTPQTQRSTRQYGLLLLRGMAMGAADVVPGVSGGTIAFITGIYEELIASLSRFDQRVFGHWKKHGLLATCGYLNLPFLITLFAGILLSVVSLANVVVHLMEQQPVLLWSFFFGLIVASTVHLLRQVPSWSWRRVLLLVLGLALALVVSSLRPSQLPDQWWVVTAAGAIAICAMILPGISGGFLLLMMGMYSTVVGAVSVLDFAILVPFAVGCGFGIIAFSHLLEWLLVRFRIATMAFLTGILMGSLNVIWPWKHTLESYLDRHGELVPLVQENLSPFHFQAVTGQSSQFVSAMVLCILGVAMVLLMERFSPSSLSETS